MVKSTVKRAVPSSTKRKRKQATGNTAIVEEPATVEVVEPMPVRPQTRARTRAQAKLALDGNAADVKPVKTIKPVKPVRAVKTKGKVAKKAPKMSAATIKAMYDKAVADGTLVKFNLEKEKLNTEELLKAGAEYDFLYPSLDDPLFNEKIASRMEFSDTKYDGKVEDVETSDKCNSGFELAPHQAFVRNFLSFQTPYNGLLLYHGLGSGKTCSAISVAEEMRDYMKQMGLTKKIIIVASPNVQDNFRLQLFDERKLKEQDGLWNIRACVGNKFLKEINPTNLRGLKREKIISSINRIINNSYRFYGYIEFANYVERVLDIGESTMDPAKQKERQRNKLRAEFDNRMVIIDEAHEVRISDDNKDKRVAKRLLDVVTMSNNMRLLLLSATPMYNTYREIIWLLNLLNINDNRVPINVKDVFDEDGEFKTDASGNEIGRELLVRKATGYVSFVRGENPFTFPFKVLPGEFAPEQNLQNMEYPTIQLNDREIVQRVQHLQLYMNQTGSYQQEVYEYILDRLRAKTLNDARNMPAFETMEAFGYTMLQRPMEALNIAYPNKDFEARREGGEGGERGEGEDGAGDQITIDPKNLVGKNGLKNVMKFSENPDRTVFKTFEYKANVPHIFEPELLGTYSAKMKSICDAIEGSNGIVMVYSQYIDGGLVPMALALEEMGFNRFGSKGSLFKTPPTKDKQKKSSAGKSYVMITGDKSISPDNLEDFLASTNENNKNGEVVKVILLSQAGGQGLDFSNIRQVHILEPWYNMNRIEQVIGRAVRNCSHKLLPFVDRNVQIFMHGSRLANPAEEAADLYVYRTAEAKAVQVGKVSRVLKETAIDCLLNEQQQNFTANNLRQTKLITLSSGQQIEYAVGDKPFTFTCDYQESCEYKCKPVASVSNDDVKLDTYSKAFIESNDERIIQRVRDLFKSKHLLTKEQLIQEINVVRDFPIMQINSALSQLVDNKNELLSDRYGRLGRLVNIEKLYMFQPLELTSKNQTLFDRRVPVEFKRRAITLKTETKKPVDKEAAAKDNAVLLESLRTMFDIVFNPKKVTGKTEDEMFGWFKYAARVVGLLVDAGRLSPELARELVAAHIIEKLMLDDLLFVANNSSGQTHEFDRFAAIYFQVNSFQSKNLEALVWQNKGAEVLLVKDAKAAKAAKGAKAKKTSVGGNKWRKAKGEDIFDLKEELTGMKYELSEFNNIFGFMADFKSESVVFKIKQLDKKRNKGARCDQAGKKDAIVMLDAIVENEVFDQESTKDLHQRELCVYIELMLRAYNKERKNGNIWFCGPGVAALNKVEKLYK